MSIDGTLRSCISVLTFVIAILMTENRSYAAPDEKKSFDCGVNALYVILRLESRPVTIDRLLSALPPRHPDGYSMTALSAASGSLGLSLEGVRFVKGDKALDRPAIAFLKDQKGGHFAVLRPVGTTGTMVQVIDPPSAPWIADYDRVLASKSWTGRILIPRDPWLVRYATPLLIGSAGVVLPFVAFRFRKRSSSATENPVSGDKA